MAKRLAQLHFVMIAGSHGPVTRPCFGTHEILSKDEVHSATDRIRAVKRRGTVSEHLYAFDRAQRNQ